MLSPKEKVVKAKIKIQKENPFFSYLIMHMPIKEDDKNCPTMAVTMNGECLYNSDFVDKLSDKELKGVFAHEVMHLCLEHLPLIKKYATHETVANSHEIANVAADIGVNYILLKTNLELPDGCLKPDIDDNLIEVSGITIEDLDKKSMKEIYYELLQKLPKSDRCNMASLQFDQHKIDGSDPNSDKKTNPNDKNNQRKGTNFDKIKQQIKNDKGNTDWKKLMVEAATYAKLQGHLPGEIERLVGMITKSRVNWRGLLNRYVVHELPSNYTFSRPSKKSITTGYYLPSALKENFEVTIGIDTSGSISEHDLGMFLGEMIGMAKSFDNVKFDVVTCDTEIHDHHTISNGNIQKIKKIKLTGGGGTELDKIYDWLKKNKPSTKLVIIFTDGYTDFPEKEEVKTIWVLSEGSVPRSQIPWGKVVKMEGGL